MILINEGGHFTHDIGTHTCRCNYCQLFLSVDGSFSTHPLLLQHLASCVNAPLPAVSEAVKCLQRQDRVEGRASGRYIYGQRKSVYAARMIRYADEAADAILASVTTLHWEVFTERDRRMRLMAASWTEDRAVVLAVCAFILWVSGGAQILKEAGDVQL